MDNFISFTMVLLILSMITEKLGNFIKTAQWPWIKRRMYSNTDSERDRKIQAMSIITGIGVALIAKANIFQIYSNSDFDFFWSENDLNGGFGDWFSNIIGSLLCGFFLSLGSKFFHDLLDMLLQIKNLKRKLVSKEELKLNTIEEYDNYLNDIEPKSMNDFLTSFLSAYKNISEFELDYDSLIVNVILKDYQTDLPGAIPFKSAGGSVKMIRVNPILLN